MKTLIVYDITTGQLLRYGHGLSKMRLAPGEAQIEAEWPGDGYLLKDGEFLPMPEIPPTRQYLYEEARENRRRAFANEADPMAFKVMRGEATEDDYKSLVEAIRLRYPYPE